MLWAAQAAQNPSVIMNSYPYFPSTNSPSLFLRTCTFWSAALSLTVMSSSSFLQTEHHSSFNMQQIIREEVARMAWPKRFLAHHVELSCQLHRNSPRGIRHATTRESDKHWTNGVCTSRTCHEEQKRRVCSWITASFSPIQPTTRSDATRTSIQHIQFTLNQFSANVYVGPPCGNDWFEKQNSGTIYISCSTWMDWFHGGLQFQLEHHLFPRLPRCHLRSISPVVKDLCKKHNLPYRSLSFWEANMSTIRTLRTAAL